MRFEPFRPVRQTAPTGRKGCYFRVSRKKSNPESASKPPLKRPETPNNFLDNSTLKRYYIVVILRKVRGSARQRPVRL